MIKDSEVYKIGVITKTHGVSGEVNMKFSDDVFDRVEASYLICRMDGILVPFFMEEYRFRSDSSVLIKFEDMDTAEQARRLVGAEVYFPKSLAAQAEDETYSWSYFVGFEVVDTCHGLLGTVRAVDEATVNVLFEIVRPDGSELLLPAHEEFIQDIDHEAGRLTVTVPEGLLQLHETE